MSKKIIKIYVALSFLLSLSIAFHFATYQLFLASRGMNLLQINIINMFFIAGILLFEVPTGAFADVFGRKKSIVCGFFALALSAFIYYIGNSFLMFVLAELVGAVGLTFLSGAMEAWAVDSLNFHGFEGDLSNVFRHEVQFSQIGIVFGSLTGGYLGNFDLALPWLASSFSIFIVGIVAVFTLQEKYILKKEFKLSFQPFKKTITDSIKFGYQKKSIWFIIFFGMILSFVFQALNMQWPFVFRGSYGFSVSDLGWLFVGVSLMTMLGSYLSKMFSRIVKTDKNAIVLSQGITAVGIIGASTMIGVVPVVFAFLLHEMGRGMLSPLKQSYLNNRIPQEQRATILSFDSMIGNVGSFLGLLGSGYLAQRSGIPLTWFVSGCILVLGVGLFYKLKNGEQSISS